MDTLKRTWRAGKFQKYSLSLFDGLRHGEEDTVEQDGGHDEVVEVLVGGEVDARAAHRRPRRPPEQRARRREAVDVVLAEPLRHHTESLQQGRACFLNQWRLANNVDHNYMGGFTGVV